MAVISTGQTFSDGEQVTAAKLNNAVNGSTFDSGAVDNASTQLSGGAIIVKDAGITTAKIADAAITKAKIENVASMKVLGNTTGSPAAPSEVSVLDEDDLVSDSATALATQQSIKAYVDNGGSSLVLDGYQYLPSGLLMQWGTTFYNPTDGASGTIRSFPIAFPTACFSITANDYGSGANSVAIVASSVSQLTCWGKNNAGDYTTTVIKYIAIGH